MRTLARRQARPGLFRPAVQSIYSALNVGFPHYLLFVWFFFALAGVFQYFGWPELFKVLLIYAYAARIPVAIMMLFAMLEIGARTMTAWE